MLHTKVLAFMMRARLAAIVLAGPLVLLACETPVVPAQSPGGVTRDVGTDSLRVAIERFNTAVDLERRGYHRQSLDALETALSAFYRIGEREWVAKTLLLWSQASNYVGNAQAIPDSLDKVAEILKGPDRPYDLLSKLLIQRGLTTLMRGDLDTAAPVVTRASVLADSAGFVSLRDKADCILGWVTRAQGEYGRAIDLLESVVRRISRSTEPDLLNLAFCTNQLGMAYWFFGDLAKAEDHIRESLAVRMAALGDNNPNVDAALVNLGIILYTKGQYAEALEMFESEIRGRDSETPPDESLGRAYSNIGLVLWKIGDPKRAVELYERSESVRLQLQGITHPKLHILYNRLGLAYHDLGRYERALHYHERSLEAKFRLGASHPELAHAYNNLGVTLLRLGRVEQARTYHVKALEIRAKAASDHPDLATTYGNLAETYESEGQWDEALRLHRKALRIHVRSRGSVGEDVARSHLNVARSLARLNLNAKAVTSLDSAIYAGHHGPGDSQFPSYAGMSALYAKARLLDNPRRPSSSIQAFIWYRDGVRQWARFRADPRYNRSNSSLVVEGLDLISDAFHNAVRLHLLTRSQLYFDALVFYSEMSRRSSIIDELLAGFSIRGQIPDSIITRELSWRTRLRELEMSRHVGPDSATRNNELFEARRNYDHFLRYLEEQYPNYYEYRHNDTASSAESIAASLGDDEALLEFFETRDSLYVITITTTARSVHSVHNTTVQDHIARYLTALRDRINEDYTEAAYRLYTVLLGPVQEHLKEKNLIVVPDGRIHFVPFESLITDSSFVTQGLYDAPPYLVTSHAVEYAYSATLRSFVKARKHAAPKLDFLGVAPAFADAMSSWPEVQMDSVAYLPGTVQEVRSIYGMFIPWFDVVGRKWRNSSTILEGAQATEEELRSQDLGSYRYLHFATHGSIDSRSPAVSGLLMHRGSASHDDVLRLGEIYGFNLAADLVVLSACDTGLGRLVAGEGVIGLTGGFLYAGARNVVVSLWQVDDSSSAELMRRFYAHALRTQDYRLALRRAKLDLIRKGGRYSKPYHWASYVLFGS